MKNVDILAITEAYRKGTALKLPASVAWKRRLNMDKLFRAAALINEALQEAREPYLDDTHSTAAEGGRQILPEFVQEFTKAQSEVLAQETDIEVKKVSVDSLGDIELTDNDMDTLAFMLED